MGNSSVIRSSKSTFIEQLKIDSRGEAKVLGIFVNPVEFPNSGLIVVSQKSILNYSPIYGSLATSYSFSINIVFADFNRKSKEGSVIAVATEEMKLILIGSENLTLIRSILFINNMKLRIKEHSRITCLNFGLSDSVLIGCSDGSVIKCKLNDDPINLLYENSGSKFINSEDEFENIKSVFSTDYLNKDRENNNVKDEGTGLLNEMNYIETMLISDRYKIIFCIQKASASASIVTLFCLRNNMRLRNFCKVEGVVQCGSLIDKRDLLLIIKFNVEKKMTTLEIWSYSDGTCPISTYAVSNILSYPFSVKSICVNQMPSRFYGRNSNHGIVDGDMVFLGSTKGDVIVGKLYTLATNNKPGFDPVMIYKLKANSNSNSMSEEMTNKFEIVNLHYDLYFDILFLGDVSSNVRFIEKVLQIGKRETSEENLPFFSFFYEPAGKNIMKDNKGNIYTFQSPHKVNYDLPLISINHDVIKDRSIILYDQGKDIIISPLSHDEEDEEDEWDKGTSAVNFGDAIQNIKNI